MKKYLVNFYGPGTKGNEAFWSKRQANQNRTAKITGGLDEVFSYNMYDLMETPFYDKNKVILSKPKGAGYWLWKPHLILDAFDKIEDGDFVLYYDVGGKMARSFEINLNIEPLVEWALKNKGILPGFYRPDTPNKHYTKRDCFHYMDCDKEKYYNVPQVGGTFSLWQKNELSISILKEWLEYAQDRRIITDETNVCGKPNLSGFVDHRHDQSIITNLVVKHGLKCYPKTVGSGKNITAQIQMMKIDSYCETMFGHEFDVELLKHIENNKEDFTNDSIRELDDKTKLFLTDNPMHNGYHKKKHILHTIFDDETTYIKYYIINVPRLIEELNQLYNEKTK